MDTSPDRFKPVYTIGEASKMLGIIVPVLRLLEKSELLLTARDAHGKRFYSQYDIDYIRVLIDLNRNKHWTLAEVHNCISGLKCWEKSQCSPEQRSACSKYLQAENPCWAKHGDNCRESYKDCRECPVYRSLTELIAV